MTSLPAGRPPLGATYDATSGSTTFAVWAPAADGVEVCLLDDERQLRVPLTEQTHGIWHSRVGEVHPGQEYGFRVHGPWIPERGLRFNPSKLLVDPYARAISGELTVDDAIFGYDVVRGDDTIRDHRDSAPFVPRSVVVAPPGPYDGEGPPRPQVPWRDTVIYELHVRGHTMRHPDLPSHLRGTYAGLAHPSVLADLTDLGVTTVELMPVHQHVSETWLADRGLTNYWGYNTLGFFAPHAGYSSTGSHGEQVEEFRSMVRAFHEARIEVLLDVVYNHSCEQGALGPTLSFRGIHNRGYYRLYEGGRHYVDITGTSNTLDLRQPQVIAMVTDSLRYWVEVMGVDGFRFDLAPVLARTGRRGDDDLDPLAPLLIAIGQDPVLSAVKLIAEPWDVGPNGYWLGGFPAPWAEWNDKFRDEVRDFWRGMTNGLAGLGSRLSGSSDIFGHWGDSQPPDKPDRLPYASINLVTAHDGFTVRDLVSYDQKHNQDNLENNQDGSNDNRSANNGVEGESSDPTVIRRRIQQARNLLTTLLLSVGTPMVLGGDERGRTQRGNNNAYCQDNEISWFDWMGSDEWIALREHVKRVLQLRREHPVFRRPAFFDGHRESVMPDVGWFHPDGREMDNTAWHDGGLQTLGMFFNGNETARTTDTGAPVVDDSFLLWLNASRSPVEAKLPGHPWAQRYALVLDTSDSLDEESVGQSLRIPRRSVVLLRAVDDGG